MASVLDLGLLTFLTPLFIFIFVYLIIFALFEKFKILGDQKTIHALVAFILALLFVLVADLRNLLTFVVPLFVLFFIVLAIAFIGVMLLGMSQQDITKYIKGTPSIIVTVIVIVFVIFVAGVSTVFPDIVGYPSAGQEGLINESRRVIFNPKVLGVLFVFVMAFFLTKVVGFKK